MEQGPSRGRVAIAIMVVALTVPLIALALFRAWAEPRLAGQDSPQGAAASASGPIEAPPLQIASESTHNDFTTRALLAAQEAVERVRAEQQQARADFEQELRAGSGLSWPVHGSITSSFGPRGEGFHHGIDIGCGLGTPIRAAAAGRITWAEPAAVYGNTVAIDHGNGSLTLYAHLSRIDVAPGGLVSRGATLGACGSTGHSTGPHLHFEVRKGGYVHDPLTLLP